MKIQVRDVVSYLGRDYLIEGLLTYHVNGKRFQLARAVDGKDILWIEPPRDAADDRLLVLKEIHDLEMAIPPPETILYRGQTYLQRLGGKTTVEVAGAVPDRAPGTIQMWRHRAAGDVFLQIDAGIGAGGSETWAAAGESVHRGMIEILPGK